MYILFVILVFSLCTYNRIATAQFIGNNPGVQQYKPFCSQFYSDATTRLPIQMTVLENANIGTKIWSFQKAFGKAGLRIQNSPRNYLDFRDLVLSVKRHLGPKRGKTVYLNATCNERIPPYDYEINLPIRFEVKVKDVNDPPVFVNLPDTVQTEEAVSSRRIIYKAAADDPLDVEDEFKRKTYRLVRVTAVGDDDDAGEKFSVDRHGNVILLGGVDYDLGPREYNLLIEVEDEGMPPLRSQSTLTVLLEDSDDQGPKFSSSNYEAQVVGEKPITEIQCQDVTPPLMAIDQDPVKKSPINYRIVSGSPGDYRYWSTFFKVESDTGRLCQTEAIPRSRTIGRQRMKTFDNFTFTIQAYQTDDYNKVDKAELFVHVKDQNTHSPKFRRLLYRTSMPEYPVLRRGHIVLTVEATDDDYGQNSLFEYRIVNNPYNAFSIDRKSGMIRVRRADYLDREKNDTVEIVIKAVETHSHQRLESEIPAQVEITLTDVNDNRPTFTKTRYEYVVKDNHPVGQVIHGTQEEAKAVDPDLKENGTVTYSVGGITNSLGRFSIKDFSRFVIDTSGKLRLGASLRDLRRNRRFPSYTVEIRAEDQAKTHSERKSSKTSAVIRVVEANDHPPRFIKVPVSVTIGELSPVGTVVANLKASDADGDEDIYLQYRIAQGNEGGPFSISSRGYLVSARPLDREKTASYRLVAEVSDRIHTVNATITVYLKDENDGAPAFFKSRYDLEMPENARTRHVIGEVTAEDLDEGKNGQVYYTITGGDMPYLFGISGNGTLYVARTDRNIDSESRDGFQITVEASDRGTPQKKNKTTVNIILVDMNDNAPAFGRASYRASVQEGERINPVKMLGIIRARDQDKTMENRNIRYSLSGQGSEAFIIDSISGRIRVAKAGAIDCEKRCLYQMKVVATDRKGTGLKTTSDISVKVEDINDNTPEFSKNYTFRVGPLTTRGTRIGRIGAEDSDHSTQNNRIMYLLKEGGFGKFYLDFDTGDLIVVDDLLRDPKQEEYTLEVQARDTGKPTLTSTTKVKVIVPMSKPPVFPPLFEFSSLEDVPIGSVVGTVSATDPDIGKGTGERLDYFIINQNVPFAVDKISGDIRTTGTLDREEFDHYTFEVFVKDNGIPASTATTTVSLILLDVNDNRPIFDSPSGYHGSITEDDNNPRKQTVKMSSLITVTDDDTDEENRMIRFTLDREDRDVFIIDRLTGEIRVKNKGTIDCEKQSMYQIKVIATDKNGKGMSAEAMVNITVNDVNDNSPVFQSDLHFNAGRLASIGTFVGQVTAKDADVSTKNNRIWYFLSSGGLGKFHVDVETGTVTVVDDLIREPMREIYSLEIAASDTGEPTRSTKASVKINVTLNTHPVAESSVTLHVPEHVMIGSPIGEIAAKDPDIEDGLPQKLEYFLKADGHSYRGDMTPALQEMENYVPFRVEPDSGVIKTTAAIDRETVEEFVFPVYIRDNGAPPFTATTTVIVLVDDINDNPPVFGYSGGYTGLVTEDDSHEIGQQKVIVIPTITTSDKDGTTQNQRIRYQLRGKGSEKFTINQRNASIRVRVPGTMDCELQCTYNLTVSAIDKNGKGFHTDAELLITLEDINDNPPVFVGRKKFNTYRQTPGGTTVGRILATDTDVTSANNRVSYHLLKGGYGKFSVDLTTGNLTVTDSLLREPMREQYTLLVEAHDSGTPVLSAATQITISVPLNYKPILPYLTKFSIDENIPHGTKIGNISAKDEDLAKNVSEKLTYFLGNHTAAFRIDGDTGMITTNINIDREEADQFVFNVYVKDSGIPPYTASASVVLEVRDVNDNRPVFGNPGGYTGGVQEDDADPLEKQRVELNAPILAEDSDDTEENRQIRYRLEGSGGEMFVIDEETGEIVVKNSGSIDCEQMCSYKIKVVATDRAGAGLSMETELNITVLDMNDNVPVFVENFEFQTGRLSTPGTKLGKILARDGDFTHRNNKVIYLLREGGYGKFAVDVDTGEIIVSDDLTRPPMKEIYELVVEAFDNGEPQKSTVAEIRIHVTLNSPPTVTPSVDVLLQENVPLGSLVAMIIADDPDIGKNPDDFFEFFMNDTSVPFAINDMNGTVRTIKPIDRESTELFTFIVYVRDHGIPAYTVSTSVSVHVMDINDYAPVFGSVEGYNGTIKEDNSSPLANQGVMVVPTVIATDDDAMEENRNIIFSLRGEGSELFLIDRLSGDLRVRRAGSIDCEQKCSYELKIVVTDRAGDGVSAEAPLSIRVQDMNDNVPTILKKHIFTTGRATSLGTTLGRLEAKDDDVATKNNKILFYLKEGGFQKFAVDFYTGEIITASNLTRQPMLEEYKLLVELYDTGEPQLSSTTEIVINVPRNSPPTVNPEFNFRIKENRPAGDVLGNIIADDPDVGKVPGEQLTYKIETDTSLPFMMKTTTGEIFSTVSMDSEISDSYEFKVLINDNGIPSYTATTIVTIIVLDVNDHAPVFQSPEYEGSVIEDDHLPIHHQRVILFPQIEVTDKDSTAENRAVRFTLDGEGHEIFNVDARKGEITVKEPGSVDCEERSQYDLQIIATDQVGKGLRSTAKLTIKVEDLNDNAPTLDEKYRFAVGRLTAVGSEAGEVVAIDRDATLKNSRVHYTLTNGGGSGRFAVNINTGAITVISPLVTLPMRDMYNLTVEAYDTGDPQLSAVTSVTIDVPLNSPPQVVPSFNFSVKENQNGVIEVGNVSAYDPDVTATSKEKLSYTIKNSVPFVVDRTKGIITTSTLLDREEVDLFKFTVFIADNGAPPFTVTTMVLVNILDQNDNHPVFASSSGYIATITENDQSERYEIHVGVFPPILAIDLDKAKENRNIRYSISGPGSDLFKMNSKTGSVELQENSRINCEDRCRFDLEVVATDRNGTGLQTRTNFSILVNDVNDNAPKFVQEYDFRISRSLPVGTDVGFVKARDQDVTAKNNRTLYHIKYGSKGDFEIDMMTGEIRVANSLLREPHTEEYYIQLEAVDTGSPQLSAVTEVKIFVPKNHAPLLQSQYLFSVDEDVPIGTEAGQVAADDYDVDVDDIQRLKYWTDDFTVPFKIDGLSGIIVTNAELDRETTGKYAFKVFVKDNGVPPFTATSTVKIDIGDVNDNIPQFQSAEGYKGRVVEDDTLSVGIQKVELLPALLVRDEDRSKENRNIRFALNGTGVKSFNIDPLTGQIHAKYRSIDCETQCNYVLQLTATDRSGKGRSSNTKVIIEVEDVNDNPPMVPPVHAFTTPRLTPMGTKVGTVTAVDRDWTKKNSRILYNLKDGGLGKFSINISTGDVMVTMPLTTFPMKEQYTLHVEVYDTGEPQLWAITKVMVNVPLNKPPFLPPHYNFTTPENRDLGEVIGNVTANDPDLAFNPSETLRFYINDSRVPFSVDAVSGIIRASGSIDLEEDDHFKFLISVVDNGIPPFTASTTIQVQVLDENDHYPIFNSIGGYMASLDEDNSNPMVNMRVMVAPRVMVSDGDETPANREVRFSLTGRGSELFKVDPITAGLSVRHRGSIDCEHQCRFDLKIIAADQLGHGLESTENLIIYINDANDNRPAFAQNYSFPIARISSIGTPIGRVEATDSDVTKPNNRILYSIKDGSRGDFAINIQTGEIVVANSLLTEPQKDIYILTVEATDTGDPPLFADTTVNVYVPMNHPPIVDEEISFAVLETLPVGAIIGKIVVHDVDVGVDPIQRLSFTMDDDEFPFAINYTGGVITTTDKLDSEITEKYSFVITIRDNGEQEHTVSSAITIFITDVNDNAPVFGSKRGYRGMVKEDDWIPLPHQEVIIIPPISAKDFDKSSDNQGIAYSLEGPGSHTFGIDASSGEVSVRKSGTIDCESMCIYRLKVIAKDGPGLISVAELIITVEDVNDNPPEFSLSKEYYVRPATPVGERVGKFEAIDLDKSTRNNRVLYLLKNGGHGKFSVDVDTGEIMVADSLIREPLMEDYLLRVEAYDTGDPQLSAEAEVKITVAMNHPPHMDLSFEYEIRESAKIGTYIGKVTVVDPDKDQTIEYFTKDPTMPFDVSSSTGIIKTSDYLDRERNEEFVFLIFAKDNGTPPYTASTIITVFLDDVNDHAPIFTSGHNYHGYIIEDNFNPKDRQTVQLNKNITVVDMDAGEENREVALSLRGNGSHFFAIDNVTGIIRTAGSGEIDRETTASFNLQIVARDRRGSGLSTSARLVISVVDENDHEPEFDQPIFIFSATHLAKAGYEIGQVTAHDLDATKPNKDLLFVLEDDPFGKFRLNVHTGSLTLLESFFSKPRRDQYELTVSIMDMGYPTNRAQTRVIVNSKGMRFNDYPPEFLGRTIFYMKEEVRVGTLVGKLNIVDKDTNSPGNLTITIDSETAPFSVDNKGNIRTITRIDRDVGYFYFLFEVRAMDTGSPPFSTSQEVGVIVEDINDNPPEFPMKIYRHMVYDLFPPHTTVATPYAHDTVDITQSVYRYSMSGDKFGYFYIDSKSGLVRTTGNLERLGKEKLTYTITATDTYRPVLTATATLEIEILDSYTNATCCCLVPC